VPTTTVTYVHPPQPRPTHPPAPRPRVQPAPAPLGYTPSAAAAALRRGHSNLVLIVKDATLRGYITEPFLDAISTRLREAGLTPLTTDVAADDDLITLVQALHPFGVLSLTHVSERVWGRLESLGIQARYRSAPATSTSDAGDRPWEEAIGRAQIAHLLDRGLTTIVYALPTVETPRESNAHARLRGAQKEYARTRNQVLGARRLSLERENARATIAALHDAAQDGTLGICAFDDTVAACALAGALDAGLNVPKQVAIIGVDDTPFTSLTTPSLSSIRIDASANGTTVAERFLGQAPDEPRHDIALTVIARDSTQTEDRR
ncbi:MAG: substrate-binding domain-containing protein, partial [Microbacterium sp.]